MADSQFTRALDWEADLRDYLSDGSEWKIECYDSVDSTMDRAKDLELGRGEKGLVLARDQQLGRGRQGRQWSSPAGNHYATFVFCEDTDIAALAGLSLLVGQAVCEGLETLSSSFGSALRLKWPNDIMTVSGEKLGGILIELHHSGGLCTAYIGIGINIQSTGDEEDGRVSLSTLASGQEFGESAPVQVCSAIAPAIYSAWKGIQQLGFARLRESWLNRAYALQKVWSLDLGGRTVSGVFSDVSDQGELLLKTQTGLETVVSGHVLSIE